MSDIKFQQSHTLGFDKARELAGQWMTEASQKMGLNCQCQQGEQADTITFERMGVNGTLVVSGHGLAEVVCTGLATQAGRIGASLAGIVVEKTLLQQSMGRLVRLLGLMAGAVSLAVFVLHGLLRGAWLDGALSAIAVAMALLPEEFPMAFAIFMAFGAWRLAQARILARRPVVLETLGAASVLVVDDRGRRWRLPRASKAYDVATKAGELRICREVATERDMLSACGTFFELPAENADGFAKIRPICSHDLRVTDFGGYRGLFIMSGIKPDAKASEHILRSDDAKAALWAGAIDDLWKLGKPRGEGGPWKNMQVKAGQKSDPYLMWAYDQRTLTLSHDQNEPVSFHIELDLTGTGLWVTHKHHEVSPGEETALTFHPAVQARWLRVTSDKACAATAWLKYQ